MIKNNVVFSILLFLGISCSQNVIENKNNGKGTIKDLYTLKQDGYKVFKLDKESQPNNLSAQFFTYENKDSVVEYYTFLNEFNNSVYFYNYKTTEYEFKITFSKEGPNGTYPYQSGYYIVNFDSIYFYSYKTRQIYLFNKFGIKLSTFDLNKGRTKKLFYPSPKVQTQTPLYYIDKKLFLCGKINGEFKNEDSLNRPLVTIVNQNSVQYTMGYPASYRKGHWGESYFREVCWTFNWVSKKFIFSFPNDHHIYSTDLNNQTLKHYAGSIYAGSIRSIDHSKAFPIAKNKRIEHYLTSFNYRSIVYDKYRNVYYRMLEWPWENFDINKRPWEKPLSIIILNDKFEVIGETKLLKQNWLSVYFFVVTQDGLLLKEDTENEDELRFGIFKLYKNEN